MNLSRWKFGLFVATLTGLATAFTVGVIVPGMTLREGVLICAGSIAKDVVLFLKQHPAEQVNVEETPQTKETS